MGVGACWRGKNTSVALTSNVGDRPWFITENLDQNIRDTVDCDWDNDEEYYTK